MNEEPKSIWKKSWKLPCSFLGGLVLATGLAFVVSLLGVIIVDQWQWRADWGIVIAGTVGGATVALLVLFIRWLCSWHNFKRFLFGLACFATLIALFYAEEDWRGWHAWNKFKHEWEAKGERFNRASVVPPTVPDDQNFALTPIVASCYSSLLDKSGHQIRPPNTNVVDRLQMITVDYNYNNGPTNGTGDWRKATVSNLKAWQQYCRALATKTNEFPVAQQLQSPAADVLLTLGKYDSVIEELRQASKLPYSRFPLEYDKDDTAAILLPHLAAMKRSSQVLQLRAIAELQNSQSDEALVDVKLMLRLTDSMRTEPFLISHLVRIAMVNLALQPVWEGLVEHKWSDTQLAELDSELAKMNLLPDYGTAMRGEMVLCQGGMFDYLRHHPGQLPNMSGLGDFNTGPPAQICRLIPSGWFYQNQLRCSRFMVQQYLPLADLEHRIISPASLRHADAALDLEFRQASPYNKLEVMFLPSLGGAVRKFAYAQSSVDLARIAIALERYRLAHGDYPESLDALAPHYMEKIPHDIINGQPLHYRRESNGQFVLYSVGWNETDDGGVVGTKVVGVTDGKNRTPILDISTGDWVWQYPSK